MATGLDMLKLYRDVSMLRACACTGKAVQPDRALRLYHQLLEAGFEPSVKTFTSLVAACQKSGRWTEALDMLESMQQKGAMRNSFAQTRIRCCRRPDLRFVGLG